MGSRLGMCLQSVQGAARRQVAAGTGDGLGDLMGTRPRGVCPPGSGGEVFPWSEGRPLGEASDAMGLDIWRIAVAVTWTGEFERAGEHQRPVGQCLLSDGFQTRSKGGGKTGHGTCIGDLKLC